MKHLTHNRGARVRSLFFASALFALASCSGGGGGGGGGVAPGAGPVAGNWNFFRTATPSACNDFEFAAFPMTLSHVTATQVNVLIGDQGSEFSFTGGYDATTMTMNVTGTDTVDGTTIQIVNAFWNIDLANGLMFGPMIVNRTEPGQGVCQVTDFIEGYLQDATQTSPLSISGGDENFFELSLKVTAADNPDRLAQSGEAIAIFYPHKQNVYTLEVYSSNDDESTVFRNVQLAGTTVQMPPQDAQGNLQVVNQNLVLDLASHSITGQVGTFSIGDGNETNDLVLTPYFYPPVTNPFFSDDNAPTGFGVHVFDLATQVPMTGDAGGEAFQVSSGRRAFSTNGTVDAARNRYRDVQRGALYYAWKTSQNPGGVGELRRVRHDLTTDAGGQGYDLILSNAIFEQPITDMWCESDMQAGGQDYLSFTANNNPNTSYAVVVGVGSASLQSMMGRAIAPVRDPVTGAFEGWVTESPTAGLVLRNATGNLLATLMPAQAKSFQFLGANDAGDLFFTTWPDGDPAAELRVLKRNQQQISPPVTGLLPFLGNNDRIPADVKGDLLYFAHREANVVSFYSMDANLNITPIGTEFDWDPNDTRCELVVAGNRIVYTISDELDQVEPLVLKSMRLNGSNRIELDRVGGDIDIFAVSDGQVYYNDTFLGGNQVSARSRSIHGNDPAPVKYDSGSFWAGVQGRATLSLARGPHSRLDQTSAQSGAAITALPPGHTAENILLVDLENGNERIVAVDAQSGQELAVLYDRSVDGTPDLNVLRVSSGFQPYLLGEIAGNQSVDLYLMDTAFSLPVIPVSLSGGINEFLLNQ